MKLSQQELDQIYDPDYVAELFDRCSNAYRWWSAVSSLGMTRLWRVACVKALPPETKSDGKFIDLMAGTGEVWPHLIYHYPNLSSIEAVDNSKKMHEDALKRLHSKRSDRCTHLLANALEIDLPENSADSIICTFGLKTLSVDQQKTIAHQVKRILKPGGTYSFIEASDPVNWIFRPLYRFYMDGCLPLIERFALNGAQDFSMIGTYTKQFVNCDVFAQALESNGLEVNSYSKFFGCATGVYGQKLK